MSLLLKRHLLIGSLLVLSGAIACSHSPNASVESVGTKASSIAVLDVPQNSEVNRSLIQIENVEHHFFVKSSDLEVRSDFDLSWDQLPVNTLILFSNSKIPGLKLHEASLNGNPIKTESISDDLPTILLRQVGEESRKVQKLSVRYVRALPEDRGGVRRISTYDLLYPARLTVDKNRLGYDLRPASFFSFGDTAKTRVSFEGIPKGWSVKASSPTSSMSPLITEALKTGRFTALLIDGSRWNSAAFEVSGTKFQLLTRKKKPVLKLNDVKDAVSKTWPKFVTLFGQPTAHVVIADLDWDVLSGGLIGANMIGLFALPELPEEAAEGIASDFGWKPERSTRQLVERNYAGTKTSWRDYLQGMIAHELAHFYFGLGQTTEFAKEIHEMWFSLGMGMVYDRLVTEQSVGRPDVFFDGVEKNWLTKFKDNSAIDQRLINPDRSGDKAAKLSRAHVYAHGKSSYVLRDLRNRIGPQLFDRRVNQYLQGGVGGYAAFRAVLSDQLATVEQWEKDWVIGWRAGH